MIKRYGFKQSNEYPVLVQWLKGEMPEHASRVEHKKKEMSSAKVGGRWFYDKGDVVFARDFDEDDGWHKATIVSLAKRTPSGFKYQVQYEEGDKKWLHEDYIKPRKEKADVHEPFDALTGPGVTHHNMIGKAPPKKFSNYTLGLVWDELTPAVMARVLRDCLQLANVCKVNRAHLTVSCPSDALDKYLKFLGVRRVAHEQAATYWRVYVVKEISEVPEHVTDTDIIEVRPDEAMPQMLVKDSKFPAEIRYPVYRISETVPLYRTPPSGPADMNQQDIF